MPNNNEKSGMVDAEGKTLGRLATEVSRLYGKHKPTYAPMRIMVTV